jgi:threonine dehydratase
MVTRSASAAVPLPVSIAEVEAAAGRIRPYLPPTPLLSHPVLDEEVGQGIRVLVKHENHQPTGAFKIRNTFSALTALDPDQRRRGVVAATRGNHGLGLAHAGRVLGIPVTVCVPFGNNPEKNRGIRALGAELIEAGRDYDECLLTSERLVRERGLHCVHSTNDRQVIAGGGTITLELLEQAPAHGGPLQALVFAIGGGSQAVGAMAVVAARSPGLPIYGVQAERASALWQGWKKGEPVTTASADTFADGLATRACYQMTFAAVCAGLTDFITVSDEEIMAAVRLYARTTHNLAEGAGATGLAGLLRLRERLAGQRVGVVLSGGNIDEASLRRVLA